jgi:hypothetical protein
LRRANYSSLRGSIVEYRRKLRAISTQRHGVSDVPADLAPLDGHRSASRKRFRSTRPCISRIDAIPKGALDLHERLVDLLGRSPGRKVGGRPGFSRAQRCDQAEGSDPEENDKRIAADHAREKSSV